MIYEDGAERLLRRATEEVKVAGMGAIALAASLDISVFDSRIVGATAIVGGAVAGIGAITACLDYRRAMRLWGYSPDGDDGEFVEADLDGEVIEMPKRLSVTNIDSAAVA